MLGFGLGFGLGLAGVARVRCRAPARRRHQPCGVAVDIAPQRGASGHWQVDVRGELAVHVLKLMTLMLRLRERRK